MYTSPSPPLHLCLVFTSVYCCLIFVSCCVLIIFYCNPSSFPALPPTTTPAWVVEHPIYKRVLEGSLYELNCSLYERSNPSTSWFKGGILVSYLLLSYKINPNSSEIQTIPCDISTHGAQSLIKCCSQIPHKI